jgi:hypothetical protein
LPSFSKIGLERFGLALLSSATLGLNAQACTPAAMTSLPYQTVYKDLCYGSSTWTESLGGGHPTLEQNFDYYPVEASTKPVPLVIWGHPNGQTKDIDPNGTLYAALVQAARDQGFAFASIEFRHPVVNEDIVPAPHLDVARALQFIRANSVAMNIDPANVFLVGQSRGTLGLWTALQKDMARPKSRDPVARQSSRVNAVFGYQAQTTYDGREFANLFINAADRALVKTNWKLQHPQYALFGSAIRSVNAGVDADPPVILRYENPFVGHTISADEMAASDTLHYPDMGPALCAAYARAFGDDAHCQTVDNVKFVDAFTGYIDFFKLHLK